jgi:hypothetical protein
VSAVAAEQRGAVGRVRSGLAALWGGTVGLAPHVLHHVGPLAGAALLVGATGQILFAAIGFVAAIPFLIRLQRKFRTWRAPAIALAIFAGAFSLSSFVIGPALSGGSAGSTPSRPGVEQPVGQPRSPPLTNLTTRV